MSLEIRPMSRADLETALGWARDEGWNPGLDDAEAFLAQDPDGFLMGWLGSDPVGCISVVRYGAAFAFLGLYLVRPAYRGRGYGKAIWDAGMARVAGATVGLDGVPAQQANYRKSGFAFAYASARWSGTPGRLPPASPHVRPVMPDDHPAILDFDRRHVAAPRDRFLAAWLARCPTRQTLGYFEAGQLHGYGTVRRCVTGWKIGPLFAETPAIAEALFPTLALPAAGSTVSIDVPAPNTAAVALVARLGFTPAFETARMYAGPQPHLTLPRIFGTTTLELG